MNVRGLVTIVVAVLALVVALAAFSRDRHDASATPARSVTVSGSATVSGVPDRAQFSFGVTTNAATAKAASSANAAQMTKVIAALKAHDVADADIQTQGVSLNQRTNASGSKIVGFTASNSVSADLTVKDSGEIVDAVVAAGGTDVNGPTFTVSDEEQLYRKALGQAVADAKARAQAIADGAGAKLGKLRTLTEQSSAPSPIAFDSVAAKSASTPVEPGKVKTEADVTATFDLG
jgi:hypothetical protein